MNQSDAEAELLEAQSSSTMAGELRRPGLLDGHWATVRPSDLPVPHTAIPPAPPSSLLRCAGCRSANLVERERTLGCETCGRRFPVQAGVPVMMSDAVAERGQLLEPPAARALARRLGTGDGPLDILRIRQASGARVRLGGGTGARPMEDGRVLGTAALETPADAGEPACEWVCDYIGRLLPPAGELLANIRFRNVGKGRMACAGEGRITVACRWTDPAGQAVRNADLRTPLPTDLLPGQAITLPVRLQTPADPGHYRLSLALVQEGVRWLEPAYGALDIQVQPGAEFAPPPHWTLHGPGPHAADGDRVRALALLAGWITRLGVSHPRILQIGGGAAPVTACESVIVDGDLLALQLGRLVPRPSGLAATPVCADLDDLPLAEAAFDAIVCFGTLHYLPDPARTLRSLRAHLRPGGFIGALCSPVGQMWPGAATQAVCTELRQGLNPQGFSLSEYAQIFRKARVQAAELVVDGVSLKARLEREGADA